MGKTRKDINRWKFKDDMRKFRRSLRDGTFTREVTEQDREMDRLRYDGVTGFGDRAKSNRFHDEHDFRKNQMGRRGPIQDTE